MNYLRLIPFIIFMCLSIYFIILQLFKIDEKILNLKYIWLLSLIIIIIQGAPKALVLFDDTY